MAQSVHIIVTPHISQPAKTESTCAPAALISTYINKSPRCDTQSEQTILNPSGTCMMISYHMHYIGGFPGTPGLQGWPFSTDTVQSSRKPGRQHEMMYQACLIMPIIVCELHDSWWGLLLEMGLYLLPNPCTLSSRSSPSRRDLPTLLLPH